MALRIQTGYVTAEIEAPSTFPLDQMFKVNDRVPGGFVAVDGKSPASRWTRVGLRDAVRADMHCAIRYTRAAERPSVRLRSKADPYRLEIRIPKDSPAEPVAYIVYTALERARQAKARMCTMTAGVVMVGSRRCFLIVGDKGTGKSSLIEALTTRSAVVAGDSIACLDANGFVWPGPALSVRRFSPSAKHDGREAKYEVSLVADSRFSHFPLWVDGVVRMAVHPNARGGLMSTSDQVSPQETQAAMTREALRLHQNLMAYISASATPVSLTASGTVGYFESLDSPQCAEVRDAVLGQLLTRPFYELSVQSTAQAVEIVEDLAAQGRTRGLA